MKTLRFKAIVGGLAVAAALSTQAQQRASLTATGQPSAFVVNLSGFDVRDPSGVPAGRLESIVVSPSGAIEMGVLAVGNRLVPVPWPMLTVGADPRVTRPGQNTLFTINTDYRRLLQAPAFDRTRWPDFRQPTWSQQFFAFYGLQPPTTGLAGLNTNLFNNNLTNLFATGRTNLFELTNVVPRTNIGPAQPGVTPSPPTIPTQPALPPGTPLAPPRPVAPPPATPPSP